MFLFAAPTCIKRLQDTKHKHHCAVELVKRVCIKIQELPVVNQAEFFVTSKILYEAGCSGIVEILKICYQYFPDLIWLPLSNNNEYLIHIAVKYRQENIFNLLCGEKSRNKIVSSHLNNAGTILHVAAKLAPYPQLKTISGTALQMQKEMQWFKVVETTTFFFTHI